MLLSRVGLSADGSLGLSQCFAGPDAFVPRVIRLDVTNTSAVSEPRTAAATTTAFARSRDGDTFVTNGTGGCRRGCWGSLIKESNRKTFFSLLINTAIDKLCI